MFKLLPLGKKNCQQGLISLETTPEYQAGEVIGVSLTVGETSSNVSYEVSDGDTMDDIQNGLISVLQAVDGVTDVQKTTPPGSLVLEAAAEVTVGAVTRDGAQHLTWM